MLRLTWGDNHGRGGEKGIAPPQQPTYLRFASHETWGRPEFSCVGVLRPEMIFFLI
jgi:hypothetical protein